MHRQLTLLAALLLPGALSAQRTGTFLEPLPDEGTTRVAQRGANFLEIGVGARARAMGEAYTGLASGATAAFWNPAGLGSTESFTAAFTHQALYDDLGIDHNFAAVILPFMGGGIGVSYIRLDSGDMPRTDESNPGGGSLTGGEFFSFTSQAIGLHYGRRITDRLQVGFTGRYITEGITQASVTWWGLDVGTMFNTGLYGIRLGAALANAGPSARYEGGLIQTRAGGGNQDATFPFGLPVRFKTVAYTIPTTFRFAVVSDVMGGADALFAPGGKHDLVIATELNDAVDTDVQLSVGGEYSYNQIVFLRAGKKFVNEARSDFRSFGYALSFGGGFRLPVLGSWLTMDYAYTNMGELQNVHAFSFELGRSR